MGIPTYVLSVFIYVWLGQPKVQGVVTAHRDRTVVQQFRQRQQGRCSFPALSPVHTHTNCLCSFCQPFRRTAAIAVLSLNILATKMNQIPYVCYLIFDCLSYIVLFIVKIAPTCKLRRMDKHRLMLRGMFEGIQVAKPNYSIKNNFSFKYLHTKVQWWESTMELRCNKKTMFTMFIILWMDC